MRDVPGYFSTLLKACPIVTGAKGLLKEAARAGDPVEGAAGGTTGPGVVHEAYTLSCPPPASPHSDHHHQELLVTKSSSEWIFTHFSSVRQ